MVVCWNYGMVGNILGCLIMDGKLKVLFEDILVEGLFRDLMCEEL